MNFKFPLLLYFKNVSIISSKIWTHQRGAIARLFFLILEAKRKEKEDNESRIRMSFASL